MTTSERVRDIMAEWMGVSVHEIHDDTRPTDLGMDSLDGIEIVMEVEEEFDVCIEDEQAYNCATVADFVALVERSLAGGY